MWTTIIFYTILGYFGLKYLIQFILKTFFWGEIDINNEINVNGKIVVITGANTGIGKETAFEIASRGATVILACRNFVSAKEAIIEIEKKTQNGKLVPMKLDLASLDSVREFVMEFTHKYDRLDILINNAGVFIPNTDRAKTKDGFEIHMGVNHLGHFLLTNLLLDTIKKSVPARIINVSSMMYEYHNLDLDDVNCVKKVPENKVFENEFYSNSKMANILFTKELSRILKGTGVNVYALCPGFVITDVNRYLKTYQQIVFSLIRPIFAKNVEEGCQTTLLCALSKDQEVTEKSGEFYQNCKYYPLEKGKKAVKEEDAAKLWKISEKLVKLKS